MTHFTTYALVSALLIVGSLALIGKDQSSAAKGKLTCNGKPLSGVEVKLYDDDSGIDADDLMGHTKTDHDGYFEVSGTTDHDCEDEIKPCQRKITVKIPDSYVSDGKKPSKVYDAGTLELSGKFKGEERDCIH
ncbi:Transthyretin-like protein 5 [Aphelenchoides besseyi]|nr:Transthyretin-like protein 5 [Aphelenchoides besseyi]